MGDYKTGGIRPHKPLEVVIDGRPYKGWVSQIFREYIQISNGNGVALTQGWEARIWEIMKAKYPKYIVHQPKINAKPGVSISTIRSFLRILKNRGFTREVVEEKEAQRRSDICKACPKAGFVTGCPSCKDVIAALLDTPKSISVPSDKGGCSVCGCYVEAKIWILPEHLKPEVGSHQWDKDCWMLDL